MIVYFYSKCLYELLGTVLTAVISISYRLRTLGKPKKKSRLLLLSNFCIQEKHVYAPVLYTQFLLNHLTDFSIFSVFSVKQCHMFVTSLATMAVAIATKAKQKVSTIDTETIISRFYNIIQMIATQSAIHLVRCCHGQMSLIAVSYPIIFIHISGL